jgi:hypothetical protein
MNFNGEELSLIRYHDGFLGQRIGPVSCLAFHPYVEQKRKKRESLSLCVCACVFFIVTTPLSSFLKMRFYLSLSRLHILLAAGATDSMISIYAGETFKPNPL